MGPLIIKVPRSPLHPFPQSPGHPKSMNKLTLNEPATRLVEIECDASTFEGEVDLKLYEGAFGCENLPHESRHSLSQ